MARLLDVDDKYQLIMIIVVAVFLVLVILAVIFGNLDIGDKTKGSVAVVENEGVLAINYIDGNKLKFNDKKDHTYNISITNESNSKVYFSIYVEDPSDTAMNVVIDDYEGKEVSKYDGKLADVKILNLASVDANKTVRYKITISNKKKASFTGILKVSNDSLSTDTFSDILLANNDILSPFTRVGSELATKKEGLISTDTNTGKVYYFRGKNENNYFKLGDYLYRVVRINEDGSVRVIMNGVLRDHVPYNTNSDDNVYNLAKFGTSSLKTYLDNWYNSNLKGYDKYISSEYYCTDTNFNYNLNGINYSNTYDRIFNDEAPDLLCRGDNYQGKIGLISVDEVVLAGAYKNNTNSEFYLYNEEIKGSYWTSSSYFVNSAAQLSMINIMSTGAIGDGIIITDKAYVRPVININETAKIKGAGTKEDPYIIVS